MLKSRSLVLTLLLVVAGAAVALPPRMTIATNPPGTLFFAVGSGIARVLQEELDVRVSPRPYGSPSRFVPLVQRNEIPLALNAVLEIGAAYQGREPYEESFGNLRVVARVMPLMHGVFVRAATDVRRMEDVRGLTMVHQLRASMTQQYINDAVLASGGLSAADIRPVAVAHIIASIDALIEGRVDVAISGLGTAATRRAHASIPGGIRALPLGELGTDEFMNAQLPGVRVVTVKPAPNLAGVEGPMKVAAYDVYLTTNADQSDEDVYRITRALHERWPSLQKDYPALRGIAAEALAPASSPVPYHAGAMRYYREVGMWRDE
ncbi:MAG: TAXI family TRAP transporter solute-binding subunit [Gammaproteobacteria bacterium]|nr:TAXI family TRAP transporter solute-binding subunit [Gammaproteobacteria bacterium]